MTELELTGRVSRPGRLSLEQLAALPDQVADIAAEVPGRAGAAVRFGAVLDHCGADPEARYVRLVSRDGSFSASAPLAPLRRGLVTYALDGGPLPAEKGGPIRFFLPDAAACATDELDGCTNVKDLASVEVTLERRADHRPSTDEEHDALHRREAGQDHGS